jgi:hypothetical protein
MPFIIKTNDTTVVVPGLEDNAESIDEAIKVHHQVRRHLRSYSYDIAYLPQSDVILAPGDFLQIHQGVIQNEDGIFNYHNRFLWEAAEHLAEARSFQGKVLYPVSVQTTPYQKKHPYVGKMAMISSAFFSIGASSKAYSGMRLFWGAMGVSDTLSYIFASLATIGPIFFYFDSTEKLTTAVLQKALIGQKKAELDYIWLQYQGAIAESFPQLKTVTQQRTFYDWLAKLFFGIGYGLGNFAMVYRGFPAEFDYVGLKEIILVTLTVVNTSIGIDKTDIVLDLAKSMLDAGNPFDNDSLLVIYSQSNFSTLCANLEEKIKKSSLISADREVNLKKLAEFKWKIQQELKNLSSENPMAEIIEIYEKAIEKLYRFIKNPSDNFVRSAALSHTSVESVDSTSSAFSSVQEHKESLSESLLTEPQHAVVDVSDFPEEHEPPFDFYHTYYGEYKTAKQIATLFSVMVSFLAITSNLDGVFNLLDEFLVSEYVSMSDIALFSFILNFDALSLNLGDVEKFTNGCLSYFMNTVEVHDDRRSWWQKYSPISDMGVRQAFAMACSFYAAISNAYFTWQSTIISPAFCKVSAGLTLVLCTTTKAQSFDRLLQRVLGSVNHDADTTREVYQGHKVHIKSEPSIYHFKNSIIKILLCGIGDYAIEAKKYWSKLDSTNQQRIGYTDTAFNLSIITKKLNRDLSGENDGHTRSEVIKKLFQYYNELREKCAVLKNYASIYSKVEKIQEGAEFSAFKSRAILR